MYEELWAGVEFKLQEARFFLELMGSILADSRSRRAHEYLYGNCAGRWQPDFYYYFDSFLGSAHAVPDVIRKCFGWDGRSKNEWTAPINIDETARRKQFQGCYDPQIDAFKALPLTSIRTSTFHWSGIPSVRAKAKIFCGPEFVGSPTETIPSSAGRPVPPGTPSDIAFLYDKQLPVEPQWQEFRLTFLADDGSQAEVPLFDHCHEYMDIHMATLVSKARDICATVHQGKPLTPPPIARIPRMSGTQRSANELVARTGEIAAIEVPCSAQGP